MTTKKRPAAAAATAAKKSPMKKTPEKRTPERKVAATKAAAIKARAPAKSAAKPDAAAAVRMQGGAARKPAAKKSKKEHKMKVVRDSFTMPQSEYRKIAEIKEACLKAGLHVKKSEVLRAGLKALCEKNAAQLKQSLNGLEKIPTGRPKKHRD